MLFREITSTIKCSLTFSMELRNERKKIFSIPSKNGSEDWGTSQLEWYTSTDLSPAITQCFIPDDMYICRYPRIPQKTQPQKSTPPPPSAAVAQIRWGEGEVPIALLFLHWANQGRGWGRAARWHIFKPKFPNRVNFSRSCNRWQFFLFYGHLVYVVAIWYILWLFGIPILWPFGIFYGYLYTFFPFWYVVPINLATPGWGPAKRMRPIGTDLFFHPGPLLIRTGCSVRTEVKIRGMYCKTFFPRFLPTTAYQGCQMVYFQTKNPNFGFL
jgi:hypothetical protein